jgi:transposase
VKQISRIGMDTSKYIFVLHGVDAAEQVVLRKKLSRKQVLEFFAKLPPTVIGMEACGASQYWARELRKLGHEAKLMAPQLVKPYVTRNKNDWRDAEGLCEAMSRPSMRFVPVKSAEQQAALMLTGIRDGLIARRTQLTNTIRGHAAEYGLIAPKGLDKIEPLLAQIAQDETLPALARELFTVLGREMRQARGRTGGDRGQADGLAPWRCHRPPPGKDPFGRPDRCNRAGDENTRSARVPLRSSLCGLARPHAQGPFHRGQDQARQDHPGGR